MKRISNALFYLDGKNEMLYNEFDYINYINGQTCRNAGTQSLESDVEQLM